MRPGETEGGTETEIELPPDDGGDDISALKAMGLTPGHGEKKRRVRHTRGSLLGIFIPMMNETTNPTEATMTRFTVTVFSAGGALAVWRGRGWNAEAACVRALLRIEPTGERGATVAVVGDETGECTTYRTVGAFNPDQPAVRCVGQHVAVAL